MSIQQEKFKEIADAIREKTGSEEKIKPSEFAGKVGEVYEAGKRDEWSDMWDAIQMYGSRTEYNNAFQYWESEKFYPKYDLVLKGSAVNMFGFVSVTTGSKRTSLDLAARVEECGILFDTSGVTNFNYMFNWAKVTHVPTINCTSVENNWLTGMFQTGHLSTVDKVILREEGQQLGGMFQSSTGLKNITFEGLIIGNVSAAKPPFTADSAKSIISCLKNYSGTDEELAYTVTFSDDVWTRLNESGAPPNGDTWEQYVNSLGYNV